ncbi:hypothetical protein DER29_4369 [Micromonospora sp. M71_S20]|nr:hypothetical protein DER29_4369 [Micromonospora sp. M71_S20]
MFDTYVTIVTDQKLPLTGRVLRLRSAPFTSRR